MLLTDELPPFLSHNAVCLLAGTRDQICGDDFLKLILEAKFDGSETAAWFGIPLFAGSDATLHDISAS